MEKLFQKLVGFLILDNHSTFNILRMCIEKAFPLGYGCAYYELSGNIKYLCLKEWRVM